MNWREKIQAWDEDIKGARLDRVRTDLTKISLKTIPRNHVRDVANICRRVQMFSRAIMALYPVVRKNDIGPAASAGEKAEYAASLLRIGSVNEARALLEEIDDASLPEAVLFKAFVEIVEWNYAKAANLLKHYLKMPGLSPYQKSVAEVNLAASLVASSQYGESFQLLQNLIPELHSRQQSLLVANCMDLVTQVHLESGDLLAAEKNITLARDSVPSTYRLHHLHSDKWNLFLRARRGSDAKTKEDLDSLKQRALELADFETMRDCDFALAKYCNEENSFRAFLFGTPYPALKEKISKLPYSPVSHCQIRRLGIGRTECLDQTYERTINLLKPDGLRSGQALHRSLAALNLDFYRPQVIGGFYQAVFPSVFFDPYSVPNRIHQLFRRLRAWAKSEDLDWSFKAHRNRFDFTNPNRVALLFKTTHQSIGVSPFDRMFETIEKHFGERIFSADEVGAITSYSRWSLYQFLNSALEKNLMIKSGSGRYTEYRIVNKSHRKSS